jgi:hypothetical protein
VPSPSQIYRETRKAEDLLWNLYVCRPLAAVLVAAIKDTRLTPNHVTLCSFVVATVACGLLVGLPGTWGLVVAVFVYELSYVLDCVDGMLARLRGQASTQGHLLDFLMDELKALLVLGAASVRLFQDAKDPRWLLLGLAGVIALAWGVAMTTFLRRPEIAQPSSVPGAPAEPLLEPARSSAVPAFSVRSAVGRLVKLAEFGGRFLIHYPSYIWLAAALGRLEFYVLPYVAANTAYALRTLLGIAKRFA